jgi:hypothetical protein
MVATVPFDPDRDLAPIPFTRQLAERARRLKTLGLQWSPHVGCFVWDPDGVIGVPSPFPHNIYFILSLPRFIVIFGSREAIAERLVWLPTWHQARCLCRRFGIPDSAVADLARGGAAPVAGEDLIALYDLLAGTLGDRATG